MLKFLSQYKNEKIEKGITQYHIPNSDVVFQYKPDLDIITLHTCRPIGRFINTKIPNVRFLKDIIDSRWDIQNFIQVRHTNLEVEKINIIGNYVFRITIFYKHDFKQILYCSSYQEFCDLVIKAKL